ncbi:MAG: hypothetical protein DMG14_15860 [Acidobacteria bacterium]|nr:MAG: hypothetical protein DMG14_15860 [Acidobacteriota bacterium]
MPGFCPQAPQNAAIHRADLQKCERPAPLSFQAPLAGRDHSYRDGTLGTAGKTFALAHATRSVGPRVTITGILGIGRRSIAI